MTTSPRPTSDAIGFVKEFDAAKGRESGEHTPTPWVYDPAHPASVYSDDKTGSIIATCEGFRFAQRWRTEVVANAAFIVRAVNAHDDLLRTVRRLAIKQHVRLAEGGGTVPTGFSCAVCHGEWAEGAEEFHAKTCCAALAKSGARTEAQTVDSIDGDAPHHPDDLEQDRETST